jgi:hypothetical protein
VSKNVEFKATVSGVVFFIDEYLERTGQEVTDENRRACLIKSLQNVFQGLSEVAQLKHYSSRDHNPSVLVHYVTGLKLEE